MNQTILRRALKAGLLAGTLDITSAFVHYYLRTHKNPLLVLKFVASGVFGKDALSGGVAMELWGLLLHYLIALSFALFYFWLATRLPILRRAWLVSGVAYGLVVWAIMNLVVVPLSRTAARPLTLEGALIAAAILVCCIGLPIAYKARRLPQAYRGVQLA